MSQSQKRMNKTGWLAVLFFMLTLSASAQKTFKYHAKLDSVKSAGFYKIELPPAFVAKSNAALSDIRIVDARGKFVPYITSANMRMLIVRFSCRSPKLNQMQIPGRLT